MSLKDFPVMFHLDSFSSFFHFLPIFLKILRLFNVIKIAVNLFMQWKECLTNGQMLARSDHYIFFSQFAWNSFLARCLQTFRAYYFYTIFFFANDSAECCGCPFFYIFSRHNKHCRYFKWVTQFLIQKNHDRESMSHQVSKIQIKFT